MIMSQPDSYHRNTDAKQEPHVQTVDDMSEVDRLLSEAMNSNPTKLSLFKEGWTEDFAA